MGKFTTFRIGELAALSGRSVHTIRWYEAQGLMPGVARDSGRRRLYNEQHLGWLELMSRLRSTGMSIAAMREYTALVKKGSGTLARRREQLTQHRQRIEEQVADRLLSLKLIDRKLKFYDQWIADGKQPASWWPQPKRTLEKIKKGRKPGP